MATARRRSGTLPDLGFDDQNMVAGQDDDFYDPDQEIDDPFAGGVPTQDDEPYFDDSYVDPYNGSNQPQQTQPTAAPEPEPTAAAQPNAPDQSAWNTDGYATPQFTAQANTPPPAGWDAQKWSDPNHQTPKYVVGRIMAANGNMQDPNSRQNAINQIQQAYPGTTFDGKDKITIPGLGTIDIFGDASGGSYIPTWQDLTNDPGPAPAPYVQAAPVGGAGQGAAAVPGGGGGGGQGGSNFSDTAIMQPGHWDAFREELLGLLNRDRTVDYESLRDSPEARAARLESQRVEERQRQQIAERAAATGENMSGAMEAEIRGLQQQRGEAEVGMIAQLAVREMENQRDEYQMAMQMALNAGQFDIAQEYQRELADLQAAIDRERIAAGREAEAGRLNLGFRNLDFDYANLAQQGLIAGNQLGFNYAQLQQQANADAIRYLTGGY